MSMLVGSSRGKRCPSTGLWNYHVSTLLILLFTLPPHVWGRVWDKRLNMVIYLSATAAGLLPRLTGAGLPGQQVAENWAIARYIWSYKVHTSQSDLGTNKINKNWVCLRMNLQFCMKMQKKHTVSWIGFKLETNPPRGSGQANSSLALWCVDVLGTLSIIFVPTFNIKALI